MRALALSAFLAVHALAAAAEPIPAYVPFDLGPHRRTVSTRNADAQKAFDQGLNWSYSFNHGDAERAFREAARLDDGLAMAWWGIALVNGPHINNTAVDEAHAKAAWEALAEAKKRRARRQRGREGAHRRAGRALRVAAAGGPRSSRRGLRRGHGGRLQALPAGRGRGDPLRGGADGHAPLGPVDGGRPAAAGHARSRWRPWRRPRGSTPNHPGALHLTIHAVEASPQPERARDAADRLRTLVPDAGHLVHMPAHIDVRLGRWAEAATANEKAMEADARYNARKLDAGVLGHVHGPQPALPGLHRDDGGPPRGRPQRDERRGPDVPARVREGERALRRRLQDGLPRRPQAVRRLAGHPRRQAAGGRAARVHRPPHFVRAIALSALGRVKEAEKEAAAFKAALPAVPKEAGWGSNTAAGALAVAVPYIEGEIAYRKGNKTLAITKLREAVAMEDDPQVRRASGLDGADAPCPRGGAHRLAAVRRRRRRSTAQT